MIDRMRKNYGFSLLELLAVVVIIGIMAAMAAPNLDQAVKKIRFKAASNTVMSGLRLARSNAIAQRYQYGVEVDQNNGVISVFKDLSDPTSFSFDAGDSLVLRDTLTRGVQYISSTFSNDLVFFFPDGRASSSGIISGESDLDGQNPARIFISVLAATGRIRLDSLSY